MQTTELEYQVGSLSFRAFVAHNPEISSPKPCVMVAHDWSGRGDAACNQARRLADLGYVGFALDMYGDAKEGKTLEERRALLNSVMSDRTQVSERMRAAFDTASTLPMVNPAKIAAIGYCFGGLCVLDLARSGAPVQGVASFHGLLFAPETPVCQTITSKILVLHGFDDPMVPPKQLLEFTQEMTEKKVDWELDAYGHTQHAFTNPQACDPSLGLLYNAKADRRSWARVLDFLKETL